MNKVLFTIPQAAMVCSLSRGAIWKYVKSGDLNASMTPGGQYRIHKTDLEMFMLRKRMHPRPAMNREMEEYLKSFRPKMKVLYMSGYTDNTIVHHGVLDPGKAFLGKPFTPESLGHKVREVLDSEDQTNRIP